MLFTAKTREPEKESPIQHVQLGCVLNRELFTLGEFTYNYPKKYQTTVNLRIIIC